MSASVLIAPTTAEVRAAIVFSGSLALDANRATLQRYALPIAEERDRIAAENAEMRATLLTLAAVVARLRLRVEAGHHEYCELANPRTNAGGPFAEHRPEPECDCGHAEDAAALAALDAVPPAEVP
jgi:hypothetical protein